MKRITREQIAAARERALATIAGTYEPPAPKKVRTRSRFVAGVIGRQSDRSVSVRDRGGQRQ